MPRENFVNLTIRREAKNVLEQYAAQNNVSIADLINAIALSLPKLPLDQLIKLLRYPPAVIYAEVSAEEIKICAAKLYSIATSIKNIITSLLPQQIYFNIGPIGFINPRALMSDKMDKYTALCAANVINAKVDAVSLLADLENAIAALKRVLDKVWKDWEREFHPPTLPREFYIPEELLKFKAIEAKEWREAIRQSASRTIERLAEIIVEGERLADKLQVEFMKDVLCKCRELFFI